MLNVWWSEWQVKRILNDGMVNDEEDFEWKKETVRFNSKEWTNAKTRNLWESVIELCLLWGIQI